MLLTRQREAFGMSAGLHLLRIYSARYDRCNPVLSEFEDFLMISIPRSNKFNIWSWCIVSRLSGIRSYKTREENLTS